MTTKNMAASISNKLLKISKASNRGFNEILTYYGMERWLARLSQSICEIQMEDGIIFDVKSIKAEIIKEDADYSGVRISLNAKLDTAKIPLQLDIAVGDLMTPEPKESKFPILIEGGDFKLKTYPKETVVAEKVQAMVALDMANSRMKDFFDIWFLATHFEFEGSLLQEALETTFKNRKLNWWLSVFLASSPLIHP